jgi:hypothetical protein
MIFSYRSEMQYNAKEQRVERIPTERGKPCIVV